MRTTNIVPLTSLFFTVYTLDYPCFRKYKLTAPEFPSPKQQKFTYVYLILPMANLS